MSRGRGGEEEGGDPSDAEDLFQTPNRMTKTEQHVTPLTRRLPNIFLKFEVRGGASSSSSLLRVPGAAHFCSMTAGACPFFLSLTRRSRSDCRHLITFF